MFPPKIAFSCIIFIFFNIFWTKAQLVPTFPATDTLYVFEVPKNDTNKRVLKNRFFHIYDKQGYIREILLEKFQNNTWKYEKRMLFGYNAINRLQIIRCETWDSVGRDWLKFRRRMYAYNIRHLPIAYTDEVWDNTNSKYQTFAKTNFTYTPKNQAHQATYKTLKQDKWSDSLRLTVFYDSSGKISGIEQRNNKQNIWYLKYYWEHKYEQKTLKELIRKENKSGSGWEILGKSVFLYNQKQIYTGKQEQIFVAHKKPFKEIGGIKSWYNAQKNQWTYSFYRIENGKTIVEKQWIICPSTEKVQVPLKDFPFPLEMEW